MHIALCFHYFFFFSEVPLSLTSFSIYLSKSFFSIYTGFKCMILCTVIWLVFLDSWSWCMGTVCGWRTCSLRFQMSRSDVWLLIYPDYSLLLYSIYLYVVIWFLLFPLMTMMCLYGYSLWLEDSILDVSNEQE